jgi:F0F1-type ATP synthase assembly protein I
MASTTPTPTWRPVGARAAPPRGAPKLSTTHAVGIALEFGSLLAIGVLLGLAAGRWLDGRLGTEIGFTLLGVLVGLASAAAHTARQYRQALRHAAAGGAEKEGRDARLGA